MSRNQRRCFLILAVVGSVIPLLEFVPWVLEQGLNLQLMLAEPFENRISALFGLDVILSAIVVLVFALISAAAWDYVSRGCELRPLRKPSRGGPFRQARSAHRPYSPLRV